MFIVRAIQMTMPTSKYHWLSNILYATFSSFTFSGLVETFSTNPVGSKLTNVIIIPVFKTSWNRIYVRDFFFESIVVCFL